jgi:hypothetical protein
MGLAAQLIRPYSRIQRAQLAARLFPQSISLGRSVGAANLITGSVGIFHNQRSLAPHVRAVSIKALDVRFGSKADIWPSVAMSGLRPKADIAERE